MSFVKARNSWMSNIIGKLALLRRNGDDISLNANPSAEKQKEKYTLKGNYQGKDFEIVE